MKQGFAIALVGLVASCTYPSSHATQGSDVGLLIFPGSLPSDRIQIDGEDAGPASEYDQKNALGVQPGTHRVTVISGGKIVLDRKYFVGAWSRVVVQ